MSKANDLMFFLMAVQYGTRPLRSEHRLNSIRERFAVTMGRQDMIATKQTHEEVEELQQGNNITEQRTADGMVILLLPDM